MIIDFGGCRILTNNEIIYLTPIQSKILNLLYDNRDKVIKQEEIIKEVYGLKADDGLKNTVRKHISLLNKKIGKYMKIKNIRGAGYILEEKKEETQADFTFDSSQDILPF